MPPTAEWAGSVATTIYDYIKGETVAVLRRRKLLAILNDRGLITFNNSGLGVDWRVRYLQAALKGFDDSDTLTFDRINRHVEAFLPWRGYNMTDSMTERERKINSGLPAIVKVFAGKSKWMMDDFKQQIGEELYIDGNASGNNKRFHGIESFMGVSGTVSGSRFGNPSDTYAGLATDLGAKGGSWTGNWPDGVGSASYDYFSPRIVDYTNALWPQSSKTWAATCIDALREGLMACKVNDDQDKQIDLIVMDRQLYRQFITLYQTEERLNVVRSDQGTSGLLKLGFNQDIINFDGTDLTWEYGCPANVGYGWCMNEVELRSLDSEFIEVKGPTFDEASQSWRFWAVVLANLQFESIRGFLKFAAIS